MAAKWSKTALAKARPVCGLDLQTANALVCMDAREATQSKNLYESLNVLKQWFDLGIIGLCFLSVNHVFFLF